jgi:hypothetical protein
VGKICRFLVRFLRKSATSAPDFPQLFGRRTLPVMSEDVPKYGASTLVCEVCGCEVTPTQDEAELRAEVERQFPGLKDATPAVLCEKCRLRVRSTSQGRAS